MFKKKADGSYSYSGRFWTYVVIATLLIGYIGWKTQATADGTTALNKATVDYATRTNDCLNQVIATITDRSTYNDDIAKLNDRRATNISDLIIGLSTAPPGKDTGGIIDKYVLTDRAISADSTRLIAERAKKQYPEPNCGLSLPGQ